MSEIEKDLLIEKLQKEIIQLKGEDKLEKGVIPTYTFTNMKLSKLKKIVTIHQNIKDKNRFDEWFDFDFKLSQNDISLLENLIEKNIYLIENYKEENLKAKFIIPILNKVDFVLMDNEIRDFYDEKLMYQTDEFIFNGEADFIVAKGLDEIEKPYFFIQEFKKSIEKSNPRPQLLAELISAVELNNQTVMKGAYIIGAIWNFVILEKLGKNKYQYFVSRNFDSTDIIKLKAIYKNLKFIKNEIIEMAKLTKYKNHSEKYV